MGKIECQVCGKEFANKYSINRHMERIHPKDVFDDEDSDEGCNEQEDGDGTYDSDNEVEVLTEVLKEVLEEIENERREDDDEDNNEEKEEKVTMQSIDDMLHPDNYNKIAELFKKKVNLYKYIYTRNV